LEMTAESRFPGRLDKGMPILDGEKTIKKEHDVTTGGARLHEKIGGQY